MDEYRIPPWKMDRFTRAELDDLYRYHGRKVREASADGS